MSGTQTTPNIPDTENATPSASQQQPIPDTENATPTQSTQPPTVVKPVRRGGLAGIIDEFRDAVAGTEQPGQVFTDKDGNQYIQHPHSTNGQQWLRVAGEAIRGAAAGAAVGHGPGGAERGAQAGIEAGDKLAAQRQEKEQQLSAQVRQANLDHLNSIKLKHEFAANEFALQRAKVKATEEDTQFAQGQLDREKALGSADLGVYKDEADLARVKEQNPNFWKDVYKNNVVVLPEFNDKGERVGIHLFQRTPGIGSQLVPEGTPILVYNPPTKPGEKPTLTQMVPTVRITNDQRDQYNNAATGKMQAWQKDQSEQEFKASEVTRNKAEANRANAEAAKARAEAQAKKTGALGYVEKPDGTVWVANQGDAESAGLPFEPMKPGDINKDKQAMRQLNDVQLNTSRYTKAAQVYSNPNAPLTYHGKPVSEQNPVHPQGPLSLIPQGPRSLIGLGGSITTPQQLRERDNSNLNTLMNKAGYADMDAAIAKGGHIDVPVLTAFTEGLSREINSRAYNELSDQAKDLYDGYLRTLSAVPAYLKALTNIGRQNKESLELEMANIKHPGYAPEDILRGQSAFQQNIDKAADGFPHNMVGVQHPADTRRHIENNGGEMPNDLRQILNSTQPR